ncbi:N-acetyl-gamma-glutamyl-phosphate reductase [Methanobrevibacter filiformis]|uniref:N-acetyl-gamma-glutamyl-phosphate reductase n=1 Tax=Methanobrevibacter filiformis TaxID=55758 RepID=A0A166A817_9EURY|nr:N-acetyl-gamma-glutamyl-phosphate reductase [Methanobrevibacter filiformis]KZX11694.1 N-acetyl-gamma-glutamyl-phosphate reductase [Methanobrevibacter filiformis]
MVEIAIIGASGYTGGELIRLIHNHPKAEVKSISSRKYEGMDVSKVHSNLIGSDLIFEDLKSDSIDADVVFTATPHGASMKIIPKLLENGVKVIDLSGDYRFRDISTYEKWYGLTHTGELDAVYGLPEIHREEIKKSNLIANPGCFPTGAILATIPLSKKKLVDRIVIDSKTGVSGGGASPSESFHFPNVSDNVNPYNVISHRHMPEIQQELEAFSNVRVSFTPHLVPVIRGILTTSHSFIRENNDISSEKLIKIYKKQYKDEPFVKILENNEIPKLNSVRGSNYAHIGSFEVDETGRIVIVSAIDNLVKGASGQAIHNMNLICGFNETDGLNHYGLTP